MMDMWISFGEGFLLVFALNDRESFDSVKGKYTRVIKGKHGIKVPILLIGNKKDLEKERVIQYDEAKKLADSWRIDYMETSATTNFNCKEAFVKLAQKIAAEKNSGDNKKCGCNIY